jgi:hypothetical protein
MRETKYLCVCVWDRISKWRREWERKKQTIKHREKERDKEENDEKYIQTEWEKRERESYSIKADTINTNDYAFYL